MIRTTLAAAFVMCATQASAGAFPKAFMGACNARSVVMSTLKSRSMEAVQSAGTMKRGSESAELWVNKQTGSWSITASIGESTCIVLHGHNWTRFAPAKPGELM